MKPIKAVIGVLYCQVSQAVLLATRPNGKTYAGYWEFPGGKLEAGESAFNALSRELQEELAIQVDRAQMEYFGRLEHTYAHGVVTLELVLIKTWHGTPWANEGQQLKWYSANSGEVLAPLLPTTTQILQLLAKKLME